MKKHDPTPTEETAAPQNTAERIFQYMERFGVIIVPMPRESPLYCGDSNPLILKEHKGTFYKVGGLILNRAFDFARPMDGWISDRRFHLLGQTSNAFFNCTKELADLVRPYREYTSGRTWTGKVLESRGVDADHTLLTDGGIKEYVNTALQRGELVKPRPFGNEIGYERDCYLFDLRNCGYGFSGELVGNTIPLCSRQIITYDQSLVLGSIGGINRADSESYLDDVFWNHSWRKKIKDKNVRHGSMNVALGFDMSQA